MKLSFKVIHISHVHIKLSELLDYALLIKRELSS
ncbi:MAG: hypothetical protein H6Q74_342 [Firmicutes bacterium]|nr:hypothetical protein [Bacillota bacterium]